MINVILGIIYFYKNSADEPVHKPIKSPKAPTIYGNTLSNLKNNGEIVSDKNWQYYPYGEIKCTECDVMSDWGIIKASGDQRQLKKFGTRPGYPLYLNILNDSIYYVFIDESGNRIEKIKTDGSSQTVIYTKNHIRDLTLINNDLYFASSDDPESEFLDVYRMNIQSKNPEFLMRVANREVPINFTEDKIYYACNGICEYTIKNGEKKQLTSLYMKDFIYHEGLLFFWREGKGIYRIDKNGREEFVYESAFITSYNFYGDNIFIAEYDDETGRANVIRFDINSRELTVICDDILGVDAIYVDAQHVYVIQEELHQYFIRMNKDGSNRIFLES